MDLFPGFLLLLWADESSVRRGGTTETFDDRIGEGIARRRMLREKERRFEQLDFRDHRRAHGVANRKAEHHAHSPVVSLIEFCHFLRLTSQMWTLAI